VLVERPARQRELANYCLTHGLAAYWRLVQREYGLQSRSTVSVISLAISFGLLLHNEQSVDNFIVQTLFGIRSHEVSYDQKKVD
jgi:hypothetical protein